MRWPSTACVLHGVSCVPYFGTKRNLQLLSDDFKKSKFIPKWTFLSDTDIGRKASSISQQKFILKSVLLTTVTMAAVLHPPPPAAVVVQALECERALKKREELRLRRADLM